MLFTYREEMKRSIERLIKRLIKVGVPDLPPVFACSHPLGSSLFPKGKEL